MHQHFTDLIQVLDHWAAVRPNELAYGFLDNGETVGASLTFGELRSKVCGIAQHLSPDCSGQPVIIMCEPGLDFVVAFLGCIAAGAIAVPVSPPSRAAGFETIRRIERDSGASRLLTTTALINRLSRTKQIDAQLPNVRGWITVDKLPDCESAAIGRADANAICLIQYTSGSTSRPKGVVLTHEQILSNQRAIKRAFGHDTDTTTVVGWLPQFHDMGLIGNVLQPLFLGRPAILMSPLHFLQRPARWLEAISRYRATTSGGPNFAYDLCSEKISDEAINDLDLSSWRVAFNGAEPIKASSLERFTSRFSRCGFTSQAFLPCYGMAEATLLVTGWSHLEKPRTVHFSSEALEQGQAVTAVPSAQSREIVCLGSVSDATDIRIVDRANSCELPEGQVGEIWVRGPAIGLGYHRDPIRTQSQFGARLSGDADETATYLKTGDLGFIHGGALYFAARANDLIIVRGKNHFPQDIETCVAGSLDGVGTAQVAAFLDDRSDRSHLVVVQELRSRVLSSDESRQFKGRVREAVARTHQLSVETVLLVARGTIPQTSSGKVKRAACRDLYQKGVLHEL